MEDFLKNKADKHSIEPKASTWAAIEKQLLKKKRRRVLWIMTYAATGMLVIGLLWVGLSPDLKNTNDTSFVSERDKQEVAENTSSAPAVANDSVQDSEATMGPLAQPELSSENAQSLQISKAQAASSSGSNNSNGLEPIANKIITQQPSISDSSKIEKTAQVEQPRQGPVNKEPRQRKNPQVDTSEQTIAIIPPDTIPEDKSAPIAKLDTTPIPPTPIDGKISILPLFYGDQTWAILANFKQGNSFYRPKYMDRSMPIPQISATQSSASQPIETPMTSWAASLSLSKKIRGPFRLGLGFEYKEFNWLGHIGNPVAHSYDLNGNKSIQDTVHSSSGLTEFVSVKLREGDQGYAPGETEFNSSLSVVSMPLYASFEQRIRNRWLISAQAGLKVNYLTSVQILQYHPGLNTYISRSNNARGVQKWSTSASASLNIERALTFGLGLQLGFDVDQFMSSIHTFTDTNPLQRKPYSFGIRGGLVYRFF